MLRMHNIGRRDLLECLQPRKTQRALTSRFCGDADELSFLESERSIFCAGIIGNYRTINVINNLKQIPENRAKK